MVRAWTGWGDGQEWTDLRCILAVESLLLLLEER